MGLRVVNIPRMWAPEDLTNYYQSQQTSITTTDADTVILTGKANYRFAMTDLIVHCSANGSWNIHDQGGGSVIYISAFTIANVINHFALVTPIITAADNDIEFDKQAASDAWEVTVLGYFIPV